MAITLIRHATDPSYRRETIYLSGTYTAATVTNALLTATNAEANGFSTYDSLGVATVNKRQVTIAAGVMTITPGFVPKRVLVKNVTQRIQKEWFEGMNVTDSLLKVAAGTETLVTSSGVLLVVATSGTAPVTYEPAPSIVITFATDSLVTDNDTVHIIIEG